MKVLTILLTALLPFAAFAQNYTLEMRAAGFQPSSKTIRKAYSQAWIDYEVLSSGSINEYLDLYAQVSWMVKKGVYHDRIPGFWFKDHSRAWVLPLNVGLRAYLPVNCRMKVYVGGGVSYSFLMIESRTNFSFLRSDFNKNVKKSNWGALAKVGLIFNVGDNVFLDIFADYIFQEFYLGKERCTRGLGRHFNVSGFKFGGGLGVNF